MFECLKCFGDHGSGLDSTAFCDNCCKTVHAHIKRQSHKPKELEVPEEFKTFANAQGSLFQQPRLYMELFALLCIETSHYVSFVKCGSSPDSPWCLFDSMADRKGKIITRSKEKKSNYNVLIIEYMTINFIFLFRFR